MKNIAIGLFCFLFSVTLKAQNFTSLSGTSWTTAANWSVTSGCCATTPQSGGYGSTTVNHNFTIASSYDVGSSTMTIAAGKTVTVTGNFLSSTATVTVNGNLIITGDADFKGPVNVESGGTITIGGDLKLSSGSSFNVNGSAIVTSSTSLTTLNGLLQINPGGVFKTGGDVRVNTSNFLIVGTNVNPPPYADFVAKGNVNSYSSGDITVQKNGRFAIGGDLNDHFYINTVFDVKNGGQAYIGDDINYFGIGSQIKNANTSSPYGLYVNDNTFSTPIVTTVTTNRTNKATMESTNDPFAQWVETSLSTPLPVKWKSISAQNNENGVLISWGTYSEKNNAYFEVEKSLNGLKWEVIGNVAGSGTTSNETNYSFLDENTESGLTYYRIKQVDYDGQFDYSSIAVINIEAKKFIKGLYPNPNNGTFTIALDENEVDAISIKTAQGVLVSAKLTKTQSGYEVELENPSSGFYTISISSNNKIHQTKFLVK